MYYLHLFNMPFIQFSLTIVARLQSLLGSTSYSVPYFLAFLCRIYKRKTLTFLLCFFSVLVFCQTEGFLEVMNELIQQLCIICADQVNTADNVFQRSNSGYISRKLVLNPLSDNVVRSQAKVLMGITQQGIDLRKPLYVPSFIHCCCAPLPVILSGFSALVIRDDQ